MQPMTYDQMQQLLTYLLSCQPNATMQQALSRRFQEQWSVGDVTATKWLAQEFANVAASL